MRKLVVAFTLILCCSCGTSYKARMLAIENETAELQAELQNKYTDYNAVIEELAVLEDSLTTINIKVKKFGEEYQQQYKAELIEKKRLLKAKIDYQVDSSVKVANTKWENSLSKEQKRLRNILTNVSYRLTFPDSAGGCDFEFSANNASNKTIKYVYINIAGFKNAVNDYVPCEIRGRKPFCAQDTGPMEKGDYVGGTWGTVVYNYSAREAIISSVKIIYMDNSSITLTAKNIKDLVDTPEKPHLNIDMMTGALMKKYGYSRLSYEIENGHSNEWQNTPAYKKYEKERNDVKAEIAVKKMHLTEINVSITDIKSRIKELKNLYPNSIIDNTNNYIGG